MVQGEVNRKILAMVDGILSIEDAPELLAPAQGVFSEAPTVFAHEDLIF